ncbi:hypothetical protein AB0C59_31840 [Streptomyces sp. NPDC048664]|uniref:MmyB family transcriptional regulator n=1 Tax=Streptomyces sp. NPDC048664 TaxID=3154505 RepID=UPI003417BE71
MTYPCRRELRAIRNGGEQRTGHRARRFRQSAQGDGQAEGQQAGRGEDRPPADVLRQRPGDEGGRGGARREHGHDAARWYDRRETSAFRPAVRHFRHPQAGDLRLRDVQLAAVDEPGHHLLACLPDGRATQEALGRRVRSPAGGEFVVEERGGRRPGRRPRSPRAGPAPSRSRPGRRTLGES